jgi:multiple sugar transport system permease protein
VRLARLTSRTIPGAAMTSRFRGNDASPGTTEIGRPAVGRPAAPPPTGPFPQRQRRRLRQGWLVRSVSAVPAAALLAVLSLYPLIVLIQMSLSDVTISNLLGYWPSVGLRNFSDQLTSSTFRAVAVQTFALVIAVLVLSLLFGFLAAMVLRENTAFNRITQTTMILVWTLPPIVVGSLWKFLLASDGGLNQLLVRLHLIAHPVPFLSRSSTALVAITAITLWASAPFAAMIIKSAILDLPADVLDAARVDGANSIQVVTRVILPMIRPTLLILGVLSVVGAFKAFDFIYVMTRGGPGTSSTTIPFLGYLLAFQNYQFGAAGAVSVMAMLVVVALAVGYILAVRRETR